MPRITTIPRQVEGPDVEWLSRREASEWLNISMAAFDRLVIEAGVKPKAVGPRVLKWHWFDVVYLSRWMQTNLFATSEDLKKPPDE